MKKLITWILVTLMVFSLSACGAGEEGKSPDSNNTQAASGSNSQTPGKDTDKNADKDTGKDNKGSKYPLPELKADGEYSVDLSADQVIYDKNDIKVTFKGIETRRSGYELTVVVENNKEDNLNFVPCAAVVNGISFTPSFYMEEEFIAKGASVEGIISLSYDSPVEEYVSDISTLKCLDLYFGFYYGGTMYGDVQTVVDNNVHYSFTKGQHDHRNDERKIVGELIYENDELAIYMTKTFEENRDKYYGAATVINKTDRVISLESLAEYRYVVAPARAHYAPLYGIGNTLAPNAYVAKKIFIDEEWSSLDINEIILKKQCYYATAVDYAVAPEQDVIGDDGVLSLEKMNCFYDRVTVSVSVIKKK